MEQPQGFFASLFDFSFSTFVTTKIIKVLFILGIAVAGLWSFGIFLALASNGAAPALLGVLVAPLFFLLGVLYCRVVLELIIVIFRIAEHTGEIARHGLPNSASGPSTPSV